ncbi:MAG: helix-turn-helix domain-containing protein [Lentisphaeria bacterium]|nr:helix-turn-helix domain-containing protein [Lentisphaeria bacterium]
MKNKLLEKTFQVLEAISASEGPVTLKELGGKLAINTSTLSRIAADLVEAGYVFKADYRSFEPALGMIRLGQNAAYSSHLPRAVNPMVKKHSEELGVQGAFAGIENGQVVYLYRSDAFSDEREYGLPCRVPLFRSNIAIAILAKSIPCEEALAFFRDSIRENHAEGQDKTDLDEIRELIEHVRKNGYLFRRERDHRWNITFPVEYNGGHYGVSFYGDRAEERNFDRLLFECSLLASRIHSALVQAS